MTHNRMTPDEENDFYARPRITGSSAQAHRSTARRDPASFPPELLEEIRRRATDDERSVSSWIRTRRARAPTSRLTETKKFERTHCRAARLRRPQQPAVDVRYLPGRGSPKV